MSKGDQLRAMRQQKPAGTSWHEEQIAAKDAEIARLREALKPFAAYAFQIDNDDVTRSIPDAAPIAYSPQYETGAKLTIGDCRRAREASEI